MRCNKCGREIEITDRFCPYCGFQNNYLNNNQSISMETNVQSISNNSFGLLFLSLVGCYGIILILNFIRMVYCLTEYSDNVSIIDKSSSIILNLLVIALFLGMFYDIYIIIKGMLGQSKYKGRPIGIAIFYLALWIATFIYKDNFFDYDKVDLMIYVIVNVVYGKYALICLILSIIALVIYYITSPYVKNNENINIDFKQKNNISDIIHSQRSSDKYSTGAKIWMIICIVANGISVLTGLISIFMSLVQLHLFILSIVLTVLAIFMMLFYILLLVRKKKYAFYGIVVCTIIAFLMNLFTTLSLLSFISLLNPVVTYLFIKNNWKMME